jgi:hypothetical protein
MRAMLVFIAVVAYVLLFGVSPGAAAERYHLRLAAVEPANGVPPEVAARVGALLGELTKDRKDFVAELAGAPEDAEKLRKWLAAKKIRAFAVTVKITSWERSIEPPSAGKTGQILKLKVNLQLIGTAIPGDVMALTGEGGSTVMVEIGKTVRPRDDEYAAEQAMKEATSHALDEAVTRLRAQGQGKKPKK